jgi:hypothetical protein
LVGLHLAVAIFGAFLDEGDFGRSELEQGVDAGVERGFQPDDRLGVLPMFGLPVEQPRFPLVPLFERNILLEDFFDLPAKNREFQLPPGGQFLVEFVLALRRAEVRQVASAKRWGQNRVVMGLSVGTVPVAGLCFFVALGVWATIDTELTSGKS